MIEYLGTHFRGFQRQEGQRTVAGCLESALSVLSSEPVTIVGAGRTDAGVHALGQVVHFDLSREAPLDADTVAKATNFNLRHHVLLGKGQLKRHHVSPGGNLSHPSPEPDSSLSSVLRRFSSPFRASENQSSLQRNTPPTDVASERILPGGTGLGLGKKNIVSQKEFPGAILRGSWPDLRVVSCVETAADFSARHHALSRSYVYRLSLDPPDVFGPTSAWHLDERSRDRFQYDRMDLALEVLRSGKEVQ